MNFWIILGLFGLLFLFKGMEDCEHDWRIIKTSDILEFDDTGYPKMLCILQCKKCKMIKLDFVEVPPEFVTVNGVHYISWKGADGDAGIGGTRA